jgi:hypothetical protein
MACILASNHAKRRLVRLTARVCRGFAAGAPSGWTWLALAILLCAPFGR